jgi:hypothetical protein
VPREAYAMEHRTGRFWLDSIVAGAAILISVASLWVALREGRTQERLLSASVWPFVQYGTADIPSDVQNIDFTLRNEGVGPARLRWATLYYRGTAYASARAALAACCGARSRVNTITEYLQERVLTANETVDFLHLTKTPANAPVWAKLDVERERFYLRGCYCSVLDNCWLLDSRRDQPAPVRVCPPPEPPLYSG